MSEINSDILYDLHFEIKEHYKDKLYGYNYFSVCYDPCDLDDVVSNEDRIILRNSHFCYKQKQFIDVIKPKNKSYISIHDCIKALVNADFRPISPDHNFLEDMLEVTPVMFHLCLSS